MEAMIEKDGIEEKVMEILAEFSEGSMEQMTENLNLKTDLGINSIKFVDVMLKFEEKFNIHFNFNDLDMQKFETIGSIVEYIRQKI